MSNKDITKWEVEDDVFWESTGKAVASRNLWISIPSLLVGFAVWLMWGVITVQMKNLNFPFTQGELFTLSAIAGLTGATLRIPSSFFIRLAGGRNTIVFTTALLMLPAFGAAFALQNPGTPLWKFQLLALLSGFGGGNFASSMSNISYFYPKRVQGYALGMNAGLGNFGVTTMQILIPLCMTIPLVGPLSGSPMTLPTTSGTIFKRIPAGSETWLSGAGWVWMFWLIPLAFFGWRRMNNIKTPAVSPDIKGPFVSFARITGLLLIGFVAAATGLYFIETFREQTWVKWIVLPSVIWATVFFMKALSPSEVKESLTRQYKIFGEKHTWIMTLIYTMTFGSFIGFAAAVGLSIKFIFGVSHIRTAELQGLIATGEGVFADPEYLMKAQAALTEATASGSEWVHSLGNPDGPATFMYIWVGAFIGALIRPVGGKIADKLGGAIVTQWVSIVMIFAAVGVGYYSKLAFQSQTPQDHFLPFFVLIVILFAATGIGNGSTFRTISMVFSEEQRGPVLGWTSAVAAYGAFVIPKVIGEQMKATTPEVAMYGFAGFYVVCALINWWYYLGPKREFNNP